MSTGKFIAVPRAEAIARLLDTAILLWFSEEDPLSIHLLAVAAYNCLESLGTKSGNAPILKSRVGAEQFNKAYDFLRHASSNPDTGVVFPPFLNAPIIFDCLTSFGRIFGNVTSYMLTFRAYTILHPERPDTDAREAILGHANELLPKGITIDQAMKLGRIEFLTKLAKMFAVQQGVERP